MVKGVNKTIIEINNTGSKYFDRVLLFVNPAHASVRQSRLEARAAEIIRAAEPGKIFPARRRRKRNKWKLFLPAAVLAAVAATLLIILI